MGRNGPSAGMHELCLGVDEEPAKSLRVVTSGQTTMVHVVGVCYRPPDLGKWVDGTFFAQLEQALVHLPWSSWGTSTTLVSAGRATQWAQTVLETSGYHFTNDSQYLTTFLIPNLRTVSFKVHPEKSP